MKFKMKTRLGAGTVAMAMAVCLTSGIAAAAEFSADMKIKTVEGEFEGKVFIKGNKQRQEFSKMGQKLVQIFLFDKGIVWNLMTEEKMYMEMSAPKDSQSDPNLAETLKEMAETKYLGEEIVNGYNCDKYQYIYRDKSLGSTTQWISKDLKYPIKVVSSGGMSVEFQNIKQEKLADSLFEVPPGYQKFQMPGGIKIPQ